MLMSSQASSLSGPQDLASMVVSLCPQSHGHSGRVVFFPKSTLVLHANCVIYVNLPRSVMFPEHQIMALSLVLFLLTSLKKVTLESNKIFRHWSPLVAVWWTEQTLACKD